MRYASDLIEQIEKELKKIPNIRYVCNKVGIDHSTFYRWMLLHPTFKKKVIMATFIGKRSISASAESLIIKGIQNGEFRAATFWLTHNDQNYMEKSKGEHYGLLMGRDALALNEKVKYDGTNFETVFRYLDELEKTYGVEVRENMGKFMIEFFCNKDQELMDLLYVSYKNWIMEKTWDNGIGKKLKDAGVSKEAELKEEPSYQDLVAHETAREAERMRVIELQKKKRERNS